uniref:MAM domain containing 2b n=1 Tax=Nothobranchius rachovii TaxID=451742 RepID=A0A1A8R341_9TELE
MDLCSLRRAEMLSACFLTLFATIQAHNLLLPGSCNFDSSTCGYTSDADFTSWTLHKDGHFVAMETAVNDDLEGGSGSGIEPAREVTGILVSPSLEHDEWSCLRLVYQITDSGHLEVLQRSEGRSFDQPLWSSQAPSDSWVVASMDLQNSTEPFRIVVDDITFTPEFCSTETEPTFDPSIASCDFESGFCFYTQDRVVGSSWRRVSVKPNIFRNGDHTTGAGSFLLAHSRLGPRSGYVSRVFSPTLPGNMKYCLRFYFSLRGFNQTEQALTVYLLQQSGKQEKIWTQSERSRAIWIAAEVTFQTSLPAKMVFISTCRSFWDCGSVALDDVSLKLGDCELTAGLLSPPLPAHCDFEVGFCGYSQDKRGDAGDWQRRRGPTPTSYTGPRGDHTTGLGYYVHIEASPMLPGQNVRLRSRPLRGTRGPQCLQFYYHMYGSGSGMLRVLVDKNGEDLLLWQRSSEQSIAWLKAQVEYRSDARHQIVFEAIRGSSVRSDIAIDDIILEGGPCPETEIGATVGSSNEIE